MKVLDGKEITLAEQCKALRVLLGYTQKQMANYLNVSKTVVALIERGYIPKRSGVMKSFALSIQNVYCFLSND